MSILIFLVLATLSSIQTIQSQNVTQNATSDCSQLTMLTKLNIVTESLEKVMHLFPNCGKLRNSSECSSTMEALEHLGIAINLTAHAKSTLKTCDWTDKRYTDCLEILHSGQNKTGIYTVWPRTGILSDSQRGVQVYCDMNNDGGGWTVIQRRGYFAKQEDFYRNWEDYKNGFGDRFKEFWLGNENIFALTNQGKYKIRFNMQDTKGTNGYAVYDTFYIDDESKGYMLHISGYTGNVGDSMKLHNNSRFATMDRDVRDYDPCSKLYRGGWWYDGTHCFGVNANGVYERNAKYHQNVVWNDWRPKENLDHLEIKIKRKC